MKDKLALIAASFTTIVKISLQLSATVPPPYTTVWDSYLKLKEDRRATQVTIWCDRASRNSLEAGNNGIFDYNNQNIAKLRHV